MSDLVKFLDRIEGHGYGGMAEYEIARAEARDLTKQLVKAVAVLEQCQDCIRGETPEDMTHEEAREDTISKIREIILSDDLRSKE